MWLDAGKPGSGLVHQIKCSCKLKYKIAIKHAFMEYENHNNDEMYKHFLNKNTTDFWKCWSSKFKRNITKDVFINGSNKNVDVANSFANHFQSVYCNTCASDSSAAKKEFETLLGNSPYMNECSSNVSSIINIELIDKCLRKLKLGKACGPDDLSTEHLVHAHPSLVLYLCVLFRCMAVVDLEANPD